MGQNFGGHNKYNAGNSKPKQQKHLARHIDIPPSYDQIRYKEILIQQFFRKWTLVWGAHSSLRH